MLQQNDTKLKYNLLPGWLDIDNTDIEQVEAYKYQGHEIRLMRENQTCEITRQIYQGEHHLAEDETFLKVISQSVSKDLWIV